MPQVKNAHPRVGVSFTLPLVSADSFASAKAMVWATSSGPKVSLGWGYTWRPNDRSEDISKIVTDIWVTTPYRGQQCAES